jgi:ABC-2 type transport system ATP-binding protein
LDEPFSGLDPVNSNIIKDEIFGLAKAGCTVIFSTHRMEQVEEICDQIVLVNKGRKILDGSVKDIKQQYKENLFHIGFTQQPHTSMNPVFDVVRKKTDHSLVVKIHEGYTPNDVLQHFLQQNMPINAFHEILPSINEIFIQLVEGTPASRQFQPVTA